MSAQLALVTGGSGFIGSHLVRQLLAEGFSVRVLDNLVTGDRAKLAEVADDVDFIEGDIRDTDALAKATRGATHLFHLAAQISVPESIADPLYCHDVNLTGTTALYETACKAGVSRIVFSSSAAVYGENPTSPKHESLPPDPLSPYATTKLAGEYLGHYCSRQHGVTSVVLRYFNVFGSRQSLDSGYAAAIPAFLGRLLGDQQPTIFGDGTQTRDFIPVREVARANVLAATAPAENADCTVNNVATGTATSINDIVAALAKITGKQHLQPVHKEERVGDIKHSLADPTNARQNIGFEASMNFEDDLRETVDYFRTVL